MPGVPAAVAGFEMATERRRAAGEDGAPDLGAATGQRVRREIGRTEGGKHPGQAGWCHGSVRGEQIERGGGAGQPGSRQMEVAHGGADMAVAEQALDGVDVDTGFEQMGGKAMAQGMDAAAVRNAGSLARRMVETAHSRAIQGGASAIWEQPVFGTRDAPVQAQGFKQTG